MKNRINSATPFQALFSGLLIGSAFIGLLTPAYFLSALLLIVAITDFFLNTSPEVQK